MPRRNGPPKGRRRGAAVVPQALLEHPGLAAAHDGPVTPDECAHPQARRDLKNKRLCRACGTVVPEGTR